MISIIGMLVGLLMPAIQAARESGRKSQCTTICGNWDWRFKVFNPKPATCLRACGPRPLRPSPAFLGTPMYFPIWNSHRSTSSLDLTQNWSSTTLGTGQIVPNATLIATRLAVFTCPSGTDPTRLDGDPQATPWIPLAAITDYSTITHVEQRMVDAGLVDVAGDGIMPLNVQSSFDNVKDGLSNTILLAESAGRPQVYRKRIPFGIRRSIASTAVAGAGPEVILA